MLKLLTVMPTALIADALADLGGVMVGQVLPACKGGHSDSCPRYGSMRLANNTGGYHIVCTCDTCYGKVKHG